MFKNKLKRCSKTICCKHCWHVKFNGTMTKQPVHKHTLRTARHMQNKQNVTGIQNKLCFLFVPFCFILIKIICSRMYELPHWLCHWQALGFKPVLRYSKPHSFSYIWEGKENEMHSLFLPRPLIIWTKW